MNISNSPNNQPFNPRGAISINYNNYNNISILNQTYESIEELINDFGPKEQKKYNIDEDFIRYEKLHDNELECTHQLNLKLKQNSDKVQTKMRTQLTNFLQYIWDKDTKLWTMIYYNAVQFTRAKDSYIATHDANYFKYPGGNTILKGKTRPCFGGEVGNIRKENIEKIFKEWNEWKKTQPKLKYILIRIAKPADNIQEKIYNINLNKREDVFGRSTSINLSKYHFQNGKYIDKKGSLRSSSKGFYIIKINENKLNEFPFYLFPISTHPKEYEVLLPDITLSARSLSNVRINVDGFHLTKCYDKVYICDHVTKYGPTYLKNKYNSDELVDLSESSPNGNKKGGNKKYITLQSGGKRLVRYGKRGGRYYIKYGNKVYIK